MNYPMAISTAWAGMLAILLAMLMLDVLRESMAGRYEALSKTLASDPGPRGLAILVCLIALNAVLQPIIHLGHHTNFAWPYSA